MIIDSLREYFLECPLFTRKIDADYLGTDVGDITIDTIPCDPIVKRYTDGGAIKQYLFLIASKNEYSSDTLTNLANIGFFERFSNWIDDQNKADILPVLDEGKQSQEMILVTHGYLMDAEAGQGRYQIQMKLLYFEE